MYFDRNDLDFLNSDEYKRYKHIQRKINYSFEYNDKSFFYFLIFISIISFIVVIKYFDFKIPNWIEIIEIFKGGHLFKFIVGLFAFIGFLWFPATMFAMMGCVILASIFDGVFRWFLKQFIYNKKFTIDENIFEISEKRIEEKITVYLLTDHKLLLDKLTSTKNPETFAKLKNEYIENYAFIKSANLHVGYIKDASNFLNKAKELIETVVFYNPNLESQTNYLEQKVKEIIETDIKPNIITTPANSEEKFSTRVINRIFPSFNKSKNSKIHETIPQNLIPDFHKEIKVNPTIVDWNEINIKKKSIGDAGELIVLQYEIEKLLKCDHVELIPFVEHTSQKYGDSIGYDISSFDENGEPIYIEVKSTEGPLSNSIFFTRNELKKMELIGDRYFLYRIYNLDRISQNAAISIYPGFKIIQNEFDFVTESIRASLK